MSEPARRAGSTYTSELDDVIASEREYLEQRRTANGDLPALGEDDRWGLAISGGGIRSATFALGMLQALISNRVLRRFDYLSTVSGGGYIGSCLSSLLSKDPTTGLDPENSPFVGLNPEDDYAREEDTRLGVRHQIHHLRRHGEYLTPTGKRLVSRDVQRAAGAIFAGIAHHFLLFALSLAALASFVHFVVFPLDPDRVLLSARAPLDSVTGEGLAYLKGVLAVWWDERMLVPMREVLAVSWGSPDVPCLIAAALSGMAWWGFFVRHAYRLSEGFDPRGQSPAPDTRAGFNAQDDMEWRFARRLNVGSVLVVFALTWGFALNTAGPVAYAFFVPLAFALGGILAAICFIAPVESLWPSNMARRSMFLTIEGAAVYGVVLAALTPFALVFLLSLSGMPWTKLGFAAVALGAARRMLHPAEKREPSRLRRLLERPALGLAVVLGISFGFSAVSDFLLQHYPVWAFSGKFWFAPLVACALSLALISALGLIVDSNRISPHYFYRDRLTEAYLRTTARVERGEGGRQGMPLAVLRNDEGLRLQELGADNGRGPYHLLVTALNLRGSSELERKTMLSDHFLFSRNYVGSRVTGWVGTEEYRDGETKLARAMTISAAAAGPGAGYHTSALSAFMLTLFNVRLGYWMENPWFYRPGERNPRRRLTYWPAYLFRELIGAPTARERLVNLSDGGHTGDNLGLLPLLARRCKMIVVADAEADGDYEFESFNNAVRLAFIEENIEITIDLEPLRPAARAGTAGEGHPDGELRTSERSWAQGTIRYPATARRAASGGKLIYIKASLPAGGDGVPVHVANYARTHPAFPHETTADQFFDDAQFESYRALGHHVANQAATAIAGLMETESKAPARAKKKRAPAKKRKKTS